jgi:chorismate mutase
MRAKLPDRAAAEQAPDRGRSAASGKMPRMSEERLFAVRGAVQAEANEPEAILEATTALMRELLERNGLTADSMVSCIFTTTEDLDAEFPAVAARNLGLQSVPLLCTREIPVPGSMRRVIRAMVHYHAPVGHRPAHAYLGATQELRSDLHAAQ